MFDVVVLIDSAEGFGSIAAADEKFMKILHMEEGRFFRSLSLDNADLFAVCTRYLQPLLLLDNNMLSNECNRSAPLKQFSLNKTIEMIVCNWVCESYALILSNMN